MKDVRLVKRDGALLPAYQVDAEALLSINSGQYVIAHLTQPRNPQFHRKMFALLNYGYEFWHPTIPDCWSMDVDPQKNFDRYRGDLMVAAGYYDPVFGLDGSVQLVPRSLSYARMDDLEFGKVYKSLFNVLWEKILQHSHENPREAELGIEGLLQFDG